MLKLHFSSVETVLKVNREYKNRAQNVRTHIHIIFLMLARPFLFHCDAPFSFKHQGENA